VEKFLKVESLAGGGNPLLLFSHWPRAEARRVQIPDAGNRSCRWHQPCIHRSHERWAGRCGQVGPGHASASVTSTWYRSTALVRDRLMSTGELR